jgi:CHAT domain-containing protein
VHALYVLSLTVVLGATFCACSRGIDDATPKALYDSGVEALRQGDLDEALRAVARARDADPHEDGSPAAARLTLLEAEIRLFRREPAEAALLLTTSFPDAPAFSPLRARQQQLRGQLRMVEERLEEALPPLEEASRMARAAGAPEVTIDADVLRGQALLRLRRFVDAELVLTSAAAAAEALGDRYRQAVALQNLGRGRLVRNRFDDAVVFFDRVLSFRELEAYTVYAITLTNAALCYARLGDFTRAIGALQTAIAAHERRGADVYLEQALGELGSTYVLQGDFDEAIAHLERANAVARQAGQTADAALWAANLASAHLEQQRWDAAERWNEEAKRLGGDERTVPYQVLFEGRILEGRGRFDDARRAYARAAALARDDPNVQWRTAARLGWIAHTAGDRAAASMHFEDALGIVERTRAELLAPGHRLFIQQRTTDLYYQYVDVVLSRGDVEQALAIADSGRARVLAERQDLDAPARHAPDVFRQAARRADAVLLSYWFGQAQSYVWVVTAQHIRLIALPASEEEIETLVEAYRALIVDALADPLATRGSPGERLYQALVAPVAAAIPAGSRVIIVPDGSLGLLNFETLPVPGAQPRYWIQDVEIAVAPSLDALLAESAAPADRRALLLIGDAVEADPAYPALRYASTEMDAVAEAFDGRTIEYRGARASPAAYRTAQLDSFEMIHFTAHAEPNAASPLDSAVILSAAGSEYKLYARDVVERPLSADLVTISACRSAVGRTYAGEGLVGFAWAFLRAGAQRVIAGLWDVDDRSTALLMGQLYAHLATADTPAAALRRAKLSILETGGAGAKPYYWAPFQLFIGAGVVP